MSIPNAPSEAEQLRENLMEVTAELRARRDQLLAGAENVPEKIETEEEARRLTDFIKQFTELQKACDNAETILKVPHRSALTSIGAFFTMEFARVNRVKRALLNRQAKFMRESRAIEATMGPVRGNFGSTTTLRQHWTFEVEDYRKINYAMLATYMDREAVDKAIRAAVAAGVRELPGVRIFRKDKAVVR